MDDGDALGAGVRVRVSVRVATRGLVLVLLLVLGVVLLVLVVHGRHTKVGGVVWVGLIIARVRVSRVHVVIRAGEVARRKESWVSRVRVHVGGREGVMRVGRRAPNGRGRDRGTVKGRDRWSRGMGKGGYRRRGRAAVIRLIVATVAVGAVRPGVT